MSEKQETISGIIAEMRLGATGDMPFAYRIGRPDRIVEYKTEDGKKYAQRRTVIESVTIDELADRLEAAHKRDCAKIEADALAVGGIVEAGHSRERGDCAKLREALEHLLHGEYKNRCEVTNIAYAALAAPPRNCDVGTAEEQTRRMEAEYCHIQRECYESPSGKSCPLHHSGIDCRLIWAQMPYQEGGAK